MQELTEHGLQLDSISDLLHSPSVDRASSKRKLYSKFNLMAEQELLCSHLSAKEILSD